MLGIEVLWIIQAYHISACKSSIHCNEPCIRKQTIRKKAVCKSYIKPWIWHNKETYDQIIKKLFAFCVQQHKSIPSLVKTCHVGS